MPDTELASITEDTSVEATDQFYAVDSGGTTDKRFTGQTLATGFAGLAPSRSCRVYRSAALNVATADQTPIAWDAESWDSDALHDNSTNPSRVTLNKVGKWQVSWQLVYPANATGVRDASLALNGSIVSTREVNNEGAAVQVFVAGADMVVATAVTDYVEVWPFQNSGGTRAMVVGSTNCFLSVAYIGT